MFNKRVVLFIENKILPTLRRSFSQQPVPGLVLQVQPGSEALEENLQFLEDHFVKREPIIGTFEIEDTCDLMRYLKMSVCGSTVIKLVNEDCEIMSAAFCKRIFPGGTKKIRTFAECSVCDLKTKRLLNFWADVGDSTNLFECFNVNELWDITYLATSTHAGKKGLGSVTVAEAKVVGKREGLSMVTMDCTSYFTAKLAQNMKFVTLPPRNVLTFRDKKGCPWVPKMPPAPHGNVVITYDFLC